MEAGFPPRDTVRVNSFLYYDTRSSTSVGRAPNGKDVPVQLISSNGKSTLGMPLPNHDNTNLDRVGIQDNYLVCYNKLASYVP